MTFDGGDERFVDTKIAATIRMPKPTKALRLAAIPYH
jgi:hypothetical protein